MHSAETLARIAKQSAEKLARLKQVELDLQSPDATKDLARFKSLGKELRDLERTRDLYARVREIEAHLAEAKHVAADASADAEYRQMANAEIETLTTHLESQLTALEEALVPKDPLLEKNVILEIRAGTGGAEASLFAAEIFRMYAKYAASLGYKVEVLEQALTEAGGVREIIGSVTGDGAFGHFKYESGVHRVQRVPVTEASGRIHTSAVTVAVLPEAEEVEVNIKPEEIKIDVFRSGGPGGQSVNTTDSAVRITHIPTGLVVKCQDEKSQTKNKAKAMTILRARLFDLYQNEANSKMAATRKKQVGSGDRSEKIRTYNFPERRVTDHRIGLTIHNLDAILGGDLGDVVKALQEAEKNEAAA
jgi:peptide chain release factor 1